MYLEHASWLEGPVDVSGQTGDVDASWNVDTLSQIRNILATVGEGGGGRGRGREERSESMC